MSDHAQIGERLRKASLAYPEAYEETPWGERVTKVKGKIFLFAGTHTGKLSFTVKLPQSGRTALEFPFAKPTGYGLGKSGWVTSSFEQGQDVPEALLLEWLDESFRSVAPKKLVKLLDDGGARASPEPAAPAKPAKKPKRAAVKKSKSRKPSVLVVGDDALRSGRAVDGLAESGFAALA
jgi:predicted DNA-binding protein (MmcQ/YjbR family)